MKHKLAIVGFGGMAGWHRQIVDRIEDLDVVGVWDIKEERREYAASLGIHAYQSLDDLLSDQQIDIVLVSTPNDSHKEISIKAMKAGKNVVCEKPVTLSSDDLQEMRDVADKTGVFFTVHQNRRWDQDFLTAKKLIESGKLGKVFRIESRVHGSRGIPKDWRQLKDQGGGMVLDWGVHLLDQALLMLPGIKIKKVYATLSNVTNQQVDDGFAVELTFENGIVIHIEVGTSNYINLPRWYILGTCGTAVIDDFKCHGKIVCMSGVDEGEVTPVVTAAGLTKTMAPRKENTLCTEELPEIISDVREFYQNVMAAIEGRQESRIKLDEVARVMRLIEVIFESGKKGEVINFE